MRSARNIFCISAVLMGVMLPFSAEAAGLTSAQASAVLGLLRAFSVADAVVAQVEHILSGGAAPSDPATSTPSAPVHAPVIGSPYPASSIGYDLSFGTTAYPVIPFGFGVVGVTRGKAFVHNSRFASEYAWARLASSAGPTMYMNLNAPYGSTVAGHIGSPKSCPGDTASSAVTASSTEPSACEGYNYGYNAAADAYAYADSAGVGNTLWWLDIEEANSWSEDTAVNDAVIQGALDYLNSKGRKVGIYSVPYMWKNIAGAGFAPTEQVDGMPFTIPTWFPIGISTQVEATNACVTKSSFIEGSPLWVLQYELDHTAIDQNVAC